MLFAKYLEKSHVRVFLLVPTRCHLRANIATSAQHSHESPA